MFEDDEEFDGSYQKLFELGLYEEESPACKVYAGVEVCPITLAALVTALFETVMKAVPENQQIQFEEQFHKALDVMFEERYEYDVVTKNLEDE